MGWPKGVKRIGYIKKDGTAPLKRGDRIKMVKPDPDTYKQVKSNDDTGKVKKEIHGATGRAVVEPCPNCSYAYADGGACSECGWFQSVPGCPHCRKAAGR